MQISSKGVLIEGKCKEILTNIRVKEESFNPRNGINSPSASKSNNMKPSCHGMQRIHNRYMRLPIEIKRRNGNSLDISHEMKPFGKHKKDPNESLEASNHKLYLLLNPISQRFPRTLRKTILIHRKK